MSVLTDTKYFGGNLEDLLLARVSCNLPLLRKDFIIDPYQIFEAKPMVQMLFFIAAVLTRMKLKTYQKLLSN